MLNPNDNSFEVTVNSKEWLNNRGKYYLEVQSNSPDFNPSDCLPTDQAGSSISITYQVRRIGVTKFSYLDIIPTITEKNSRVDFVVSGSPYTATLPLGFWNIPTYGPLSFLNALVNAMNAVSGVPFSITPVASRAYGSVYGGGMFYQLDAGPGNTFAFVDNKRTRRLTPVFGPNWDPVESQIKVIGPLLLQSTRYFDLRSRILTEDQKIPSQSNQFGSNSTLIRIYPESIYNNQDNLVGPPNPVGNFSGRRVVIEPQHPRWINRDPQKPITNISISLVDEFGEELETLPPISDSNGYPFAFSVELLMEPI